MSTQPSKSDLLGARVRRYPSHDRLLLIRNLSYGAAAACLAVLAGLTQVGAKSIALQVSVYSASIALPIWLLIGAVYEYYIFLGKQSYPHLRTRFFMILVALTSAIASLGMVGMIVGIIWFLIPEAAYAFGLSALVAFVLGSAFQVHLARWWFRAGGPGMSDGADDA